MKHQADYIKIPSDLLLNLCVCVEDTEKHKRGTLCLVSDADGIIGSGFTLEQIKDALQGAPLTFA